MTWFPRWDILVEMVLDWPFGTVCSFFMYLSLVYIMVKIVRAFSVRLIPYEFEVWNNK